MQFLINGIINGLTIAVFALGFSVIYLPTRIFAVALAGLYVLAPYLVWQARQWGFPWVGAVAVALLGVVSLSVVFERFNHRSLARRNASAAVHMIASLGIFIILVQVVALWWGNETHVLREGVGASVTVGGITLARTQLLSGVVSLFALSGFYAGLRCTRLGLHFRALADNPVQLAIHGINTDRLRLLAAGMAGFLTATSSVLVAYDVGFDPNGGLSALLLAIVAVIVGGRQSFFAPVLGGVLVGVLRSGVVWFLSARWQEAGTFLLLVLILFFVPRGLFGRKVRLEAEA